MSLPANETVPSVGGCSPQITLNSVVLPAPFGPIRPVTMPSSTSRSTPWSACTPPNRTSTSATSSSANASHLLPEDGVGVELAGVDGGRAPHGEPSEPLVHHVDRAVGVPRDGDRRGAGGQIQRAADALGQEHRQVREEQPS